MNNMKSWNNEDEIENKVKEKSLDNLELDV
jgi:hypothetical protein